MKRLVFLAVLSFAFESLAGGVRPPGLGDVKQVSVTDEPALTRVVIELSGPAKFESHSLDNPNRTYIDVDGTWLEGAAASPQPGSFGSPLRVVRGGQNTLTRSRIVLELTRGGVTPKIYTLEAPFRIVAELPKTAKAQQPAPAPQPKIDVASAPKSVTPAPSVQPQLQQPDWDQRAVRRIVIDAGHGG